jgi:acetoin utilization deacetylase AcuC-like enzyme
VRAACVFGGGRFFSAAMPLPIVHNPRYQARLPPNHRFPMAKFRRVAEVLVEDGLVAAGGFHEPAPAPAGWVALAHERSYVDQVFAASVPERIAREIGFPMTADVALRARTASAGTLLTARLALEHGIACNTAGGSPPARRALAAGSCVYTVVAGAIADLFADGAVATAMVIDCDVHQGDGTADIFAGDPRVYTLSIHAENNYPVRKVASTRDIGLPDGTADAAYLEALRAVVPQALDAFAPDIVFVNAGVDPHRDDRLGRLALTDRGLLDRNRFVMDAVRRRGIALAGVLGGGYSADIDSLARRHTLLHRAALEFV